MFAIEGFCCTERIGKALGKCGWVHWTLAFCDLTCVALYMGVFTILLKS